jgi:hypothetical protein
MRALLLLACVAATASCLRQTEFKCITDTDCSSSGAVCESTGYCSFADTQCPDGRRYGELSGSYAGQCVGGGGDGGVDGAIDVMPSGNCPTGYAPLPGAGDHEYKLTANSQQWSTQRDRCAGDGANVYLAIPDNEGELMAIATASAAARTWIGIHDQTTEGMFETVLGGAATFLPWAAGGEPTNENPPPGEDCVSALMNGTEIATDRCTITLPAVCECEP